MALKKINENKLSKDVAFREGGKQELGIGQIKEVQRCLLDELANSYEMSQVVELIERHRDV